MSARSKARKRALDVLFESDLRGSDPAETLRLRRAQADPPIGDYADVIINGVVENKRRLDDLIATYSTGWDLDRMPAVDRNLLRIAIFELLFEKEIPAAVAIDEAVELAKSLSTDESATFINGVLGQVALLRPAD
jgi:transcription antitermination protein NusB